MNDNYLEELMKREEKKLEAFLESALQTINLGFKELESIRVTSYEYYDKVLEVIHLSGRVSYININMNSIEATARVLFEYILYGNATGLINREE
jgi:hypothetical protein